MNKMKVAELKVELEKHGADTKGLKAVLVERLWCIISGEEPEEPVVTKSRGGRTRK